MLPNLAKSNLAKSGRLTELPGKSGCDSSLGHLYLWNYREWMDVSIPGGIPGVSGRGRASGLRYEASLPWPETPPRQANGRIP